MNTPGWLGFITHGSVDRAGPRRHRHGRRRGPALHPPRLQRARAHRAALARGPVRAAGRRDGRVLERRLDGEPPRPRGGPPGGLRAPRPRRLRARACPIGRPGPHLRLGRRPPHDPPVRGRARPGPAGRRRDPGRRRGTDRPRRARGGPRPRRAGRHRAGRGRRHRGRHRHGLGGPDRAASARSPAGSARGSTSTGRTASSPTRRRACATCSRASRRPTRGSWTRTSGSPRGSGSGRRSCATRSCSRGPSRRARPRTSRARSRPTTCRPPPSSTSWPAAGPTRASSSRRHRAACSCGPSCARSGRRGVIDRVERHVAFARAVADAAVAHPRLELLMEPQLSVACFRYVPDRGASDADVDALNQRILERLRAETPHRAVEHARRTAGSRSGRASSTRGRPSGR